jgi:DNA-binding NtrC family response regulator
MKNSNSTPKRRGNVLIVEDDADIAEYCDMVLTSSGYGVRTVSSREDALRVVHGNLYNYILMDLRMPGMPIDEFLACKERHFPTSKVIIMTADFISAKKVDHLVSSKILMKPFDPDKLLHHL